MPGSTRARPRRDRRGNDPDERMRRAREAQQAAYEAARAVLDQASARRDARWREVAAENRRRALVVLLAPLAVGAVVGILGIVTVALAAVGGVLLVAWAAVAAFSWSWAGGGARRLPGGLDVDTAAESGAVSLRASERVEDLTESLCAALGLPVPELLLLAEAAPNALVLGRDPGTTTLVATAGLVERLERIELEGVLAHELSHVKRLDVLTGTLAGSPAARVLDALSGGRAGRYLLGEHRELATDLAAVSVTRYPPGLLIALERVEAAGGSEPAAVPAEVRRRTAPLWLVPFDPAGLDERVDVLREL